MDAQEARKTALQFNTSVSNSEYASLKKRIEEAAKKGKYSISLTSTPHSDVKKKLTSEGFKIEYSNDPRDNYSEIWLSW